MNKLITDLKKYLKQNCTKLIAYIFLKACFLIVALFIPYFIGMVTNQINSPNVVNLISKYAIIIIVLLVGSILLVLLVNILEFVLKLNIAIGINSDVIEYVKRLPNRYFSTHNSSYINHQINLDSNVIANFIVDQVIRLFYEIIKLVVVIGLLFYIDVHTTVINIFILTVYFGMYIVFKRIIYKYNYIFKESQSSLFSEMEYQLFNVKFLKINAAFDMFWKRFDKVMGVFKKNAFKFCLVSVMYEESGVFVEIVILVVNIFIGWNKIQSGSLTLGDLIIIISYLYYLINSISTTMNIGKEYQNFKVSMDRIGGILNVNSESNGDKVLTSIETIRLDNIYFKYTDRYVLDNISYNFHKGKLYCIKGRNGVGKTTLVNLMLGIEEPSSGCIYYNDTNIRDIDMYSLRRRHIAVLEQEPILLRDTILNNLIMGSEKANKEVVDSWCKKLNIYEHIENLSEKYNTVVDEHFTIFSGGEKQKIALARIFVKNSNLMILDEPTSALDKKTTNDFLNILNEYKKDKIIIIISHDLNIEKYADEIIDLENI